MRRIDVNSVDVGKVESQSCELPCQFLVARKPSGWINRAAYDSFMPWPKWLRARVLLVLSAGFVAVCWGALLVEEALRLMWNVVGR
jgi:hypothetical protein